MSRICLALLVALIVLTSSAVETGIAEERPNILFCIADDASYPHMSAYGCRWIDTPGFDRVARQGILFSNAYTPNAKCAPSRACILTGRNSWQLEQAANHFPFFPTKFKTFVEALAANGYVVGNTGKTWSPGVALDEDGKPRQLAGPSYGQKKTKPPTRGISGNDYAANFTDFINSVPADQPWFFWYGGFEPHRRYEYGSGIAKGGRKTSDIDDVPDFWPDNETVRTDMLDYAFEIEYFDSHLASMLDTLESKGELSNTLVVVTSDNGMPFPRVKGQEYELSNHLPLAIMWPDGISNPGRTVDDYISFVDFAPTFIEAAQVSWDSTGMQPSPGKSLMNLFVSGASGIVDASRDHVLIGKERHDVGRPNDWGYPIRGIVKDNMLYLHNFETSRWPGGNPETGYLNCDGSPTKTEVLQARTNPAIEQYWKLSFGKRQGEEMFNVKGDAFCVKDLSALPEFANLKNELKDQLFSELRTQGDPRMFGNGKLFDDYLYSSPDTRNFHERYMSGEKIKAGWVNPTDFEAGPLD